MCGFSQGGALALHVGLRGLAAGSGSGEGGKSFAGVAALSAWLPLRDTYPGALGPGAAELPILQCHGDADQVVNYGWGKGSFELLAGKGGAGTSGLGLRAAEWRDYPGMAHSACDKEIMDVSAFLRRVLGYGK